MLPGPAFDGLTARYRGVAPGVDLKVQGDGEGFEQRIVITRRPRGRAAFRFPLWLRGLRARVAAKGAVEFLDARGSVVAKGLPGREAGAQTDPLTGEPTRTAAVAIRVVAGPGGGQALEVVPDQSFLRDAKVRYPVTIDTGAIGVTSTPSTGSTAPLLRSAGSALVRPLDPCMPGTTNRPSGGVDGGVYAAGDPCLPGAPTDVAATGFNEKVLVTWGAPVDGNPPLSYSVTAHRASDGSVLASRTVSAGFSPSAEFTFRDGVANGAGYYVDVVASNDAGDGPGASSTSVTPAAAPWSQLDVMGGSNPSEPGVTCHTSWGVECDTGNFSYSHTDLRVPGRGIPLEFTSTYNSQDPRRWTNNYAMRVESAGSARIVHQENGSTVYFFDDGQSGWHAEGGAQATLASDPGGGYTFRRTHALTSFTFSSEGKLVSESDRNGYQTALIYDGNGQLSRVTDPAGRSLTFAYYNLQGSPGPPLWQVTDPAGRHVTFTYENVNPGGVPVWRPQSLTDAAGGVTTYGYAPNAEWHLTRIVRPNGNVQTNAYAGAALDYQTGGPSGRSMSYAYTHEFNSDTPVAGVPTSNTTTITDSRGNVVVARHTNYLLTSLTRGSGSAQEATSSFTRDPVAMRTTATTDPRGHVWRSTYDATANLLTRIDPLGRRTTYTYDAKNQPLTETDPLGVTTTSAYDANSNLTSVSRPLTGSSDTQRTSYAYDPARRGDLQTRTDPNGKAWRYGYDANGDRTSQTDPLGNQATFGYDAVGHKTSATSPRGNVPGANPAQYTSIYGYDGLDDVKSVTDPLGNATSFDYDANQNLTARTDANGHRTSYAYDRFDEPVTVTRPDGSTLQTGYDQAGNVVGQTDPAGKTTSYGYDALNRRVSETDPLGRARSYGYDATGNRTSLTDPAGKTTSYGYDDANQPTSLTYSDGTTPGVSYSYDADGQRTSMSDGSGQSSYVYDSLHRLTRHTDGAGHTVTYDYDLNGQPTSIGYPSALGGGGGTVSRGYDDAGRLSSVGDWLGYTTQFGYDPDSQLTSQSYPNGATASNGYDNAGRLTSIADSSPSAGQFLNLPYGRDPAGLLTSEGSKAFSYDANDRLKTQSTAPAVTYGYDSADNSTSANVTGGASKTRSYDDAHQLTAMTTTTGGTPATANYTYDANGNRTSDGTSTYTYDQANRLTANLTTRYAYDGDGLRTKKTPLLGAEPYTWDITAPIPEIIGDADTAYITGPDGLPLEQITSSGTVHYYHQDQLGSTRAITDQSGAVSATASYDPYGNATSQTGSLTNPFGYAGQYTDSETGLQYLRARYYDPNTQNFLTRDPQAPTTRAPYNYAGDTPTNNTDPTGLGCAATQQDGGSGPGEVNKAPDENPDDPEPPDDPQGNSSNTNEPTEGPKPPGIRGLPPELCELCEFAYGQDPLHRALVAFGKAVERIIGGRRG